MRIRTLRDEGPTCCLAPGRLAVAHQGRPAGVGTALTALTVRAACSHSFASADDDNDRNNLEGARNVTPNDD